jgi:hypothetical protein
MMVMMMMLLGDEGEDDLDLQRKSAHVGPPEERKNGGAWCVACSGTTSIYIHVDRNPAL